MVMKLVSGEEIFGIIGNVKDGSVLVYNPLILVSRQGGQIESFHFTRFLPYTLDHQVSINVMQLVSIDPPNNEYKNYYLKSLEYIMMYVDEDAKDLVNKASDGLGDFLNSLEDKHLNRESRKDYESVKQAVDNFLESPAGEKIKKTAYDVILNNFNVTNESKN